MLACVLSIAIARCAPVATSAAIARTVATFDGKVDLADLIRGSDEIVEAEIIGTRDLERDSSGTKTLSRLLEVRVRAVLWGDALPPVRYVVASLTIDAAGRCRSYAVGNGGISDIGANGLAQILDVASREKFLDLPASIGRASGPDSSLISRSAFAPSTDRASCASRVRRRRRIRKSMHLDARPACCEPFLTPRIGASTGREKPARSLFGAIASRQ